MSAFSPKQNQARQRTSSTAPPSVDRAPARSQLEDRLTALQRAIGNQAVLRLLQAKADGAEVGPANPLNQTSSPFRLPAIIRPKLAINSPGDVYEQEADRVAEQVTRMPAVPATAAVPSGSAPAVQRECSCGGTCAECQKEQRDDEHAHVQMKATAPGSAAEIEAPPIVHEVLRSPGQPLDAATRAFMEPRFGRDFSSVRIHADPQAGQSAQAVNAEAYTVGRDIVFGAGRFAPGTQAGRRLLSHELTHVVQEEAAFSGPPRIQREPDTPAKDEGCGIKNANAYIYFEIARRFKDPNDPQVLKRAHCLIKAFTMLSAKHAVQFAQYITKHETPFYSWYETLATPTRMKIAKILADILSRKDTETYLARLLFTSLVTPYGPEIKPPQIVTSQVQGKTGATLLKITLDLPVVAGASAEVFGPSDCEKYVFGITQFETEATEVSNYYDVVRKHYTVVDWGLKRKPFLPCQDVFADGDVWSYSEKLDCGSKGVVKKLSHTKLFSFEDTPSGGVGIFSGDPSMVLSGVTWNEKFTTVFSVMLPNGVVHHLSWFTWRINFCQNWPLSLGKQRRDSQAQVSVDPVEEGEPPFDFVKRVGKPAGKACNNIKGDPDVSIADLPSIKCV